MSTTLPNDATGPEVQAEAQRRQLQRVADALAWSLEPRAVAAQLVEAACNALGAPKGWCAVSSDDGREVLLLAAHGYADEALAPWLRVPIDADVPMTVAIRSGRAVAHASAEERVREYPALLGTERAGYVEASAVVPMVFEGTTTGALAVTFDEVRPIASSERWFLEALAAYGAGALERARLFAAVRARDTRLQLALEASGTWIWEWDVSSDKVTWAPSPPAFAEASGEDASADAWLRTVHPDDRSRVEKTLAACLASGDPYEMEYRVGQPGDPELWLLGIGRLLPSHDDRPPTIMGITRDVTERKLAELDRNRRLEAEREAARLRDAFNSVVSHELRTPITTIFGGSRVLARRWREMEPAARDALLTDVSSEADRLYRMVEDLLVITRVERGSLDIGDEPVTLRPIVERVVASERTRSPEVIIEVVMPPDLPSVQGEEMYLEQVLRNLLANAAKYGGAGSRVTLTATVTPEEVILGVLDEGPGIVEAEAEQLFELFYRSPSTAPTVAGAGIGLFVCRQLVRAMHGSIRARNRPEGGAAFELAIRRCQDDGDA